TDTYVAQVRYSGVGHLLLKGGTIHNSGSVLGVPLQGPVAGNVFNVMNTLASTAVTINPGPGADAVNIVGTGGQVEADGGVEVTVGKGPLAGTAGAALIGPRPPAPNGATPSALPQVIVDDSADISHPSVGLAANQGPFDQAITGLTATPIVYASAAVASVT